MRHLLTILLFLIPAPLFGACHVITPSGGGTNSGADWNNPCAAFSGNCAPASMVRGDSYYLGKGTYNVGANTLHLNKAVSGTSTIGILGATAADHCTATGWSASSFAVDGTSTNQARFISGLTWASSSTGSLQFIVAVDTGYWNINGNTCTAGQITKSGQGILIDNGVYAASPTASSVGLPFRIDSTASGISGTINVTCMETIGSGMGSDGDAADFSDLSSIACNSAGTVATVTLNGATRWFPQGTAADGTPMPASQVTISSVPSGNFNASHVLVTGNPSNTSFTYNVSCTSNATASSGSVRGAYAYGSVGDQDVLVGWPSPNTLTEGTINFQYDSIHDSDNEPWQVDSGVTGTWDHIYTARNAYVSTDHGSAWTLSGQAGSNITISNSVFEDIESTAWVTALNGGVINPWNIYGNTFSYSVNNPYNRRGTGNAIVACINSGTSCSNVFVENNTVSDVTGTNVNGTSGAWVYVESGGGAASNYTIEDNLAFNSNTGANAGAGTPSGTYTVDYNTYENSPTFGSDAGTHSFHYTGGANPFINNSTFNYQLSSETVAAHLNDGVTLSSPSGIATDPNGLTRGADSTWERGAFEFNNSGPAASWNVSTYSYGSISVGQSSGDNTFTLTSNGASTLTLNSSSAITITGTNASDFVLDVNNCTNNLSMPVNNTCTVQISFHPSASGSRTATLSANDNGTNTPQTISLSGTGLASSQQIIPPRNLIIAGP